MLNSEVHTGKTGSGAREKMGEQVPSNGGTWGHRLTECPSSSALSGPRARRSVGSVIKQDLMPLSISYMALGLNFLICEMEIVTISTFRGVVQTKCKTPGVVPGVG